MESKIDDGGPAFPVTYNDDGYKAPTPGMSLRDYFAAKAMAAMVNSVVFPQAVEDQLHKAGLKTEEFESWTAHVAVSFADALIAELRRPK